MNRTYTVEEYLALVNLITTGLPNVTLSTDIIVGFPGETQQDYEATRAVVEKIRFQMIYSFIYSPRKYTKAMEMEDDCPHEVKWNRLQDLQQLHRQIGTEKNKALVGKKMRVLIEEQIDKNLFVGRTDGNVRVIVRGEGIKIAQFVDVLIEEGRLSDIQGVVCPIKL